MTESDVCPVCDRECDSEWDHDQGDRWTDVRIYWCESCHKRYHFYPTTEHDSLALDRAIEDRLMGDC